MLDAGSKRGPGVITRQFWHSCDLYCEPKQNPGAKDPIGELAEHFTAFWWSGIGLGCKILCLINKNKPESKPYSVPRVRNNYSSRRIWRAVSHL